MESHPIKHRPADRPALAAAGLSMDGPGLPRRRPFNPCLHPPRRDLKCGIQITQTIKNGHVLFRPSETRRFCKTGRFWPGPNPLWPCLRCFYRYRTDRSRASELFSIVSSRQFCDLSRFRPAPNPFRPCLRCFYRYRTLLTCREETYNRTYYARPVSEMVSEMDPGSNVRQSEMRFHQSDTSSERPRVRMPAGGTPTLANADGGSAHGCERRRKRAPTGATA